MADLDLTQIGTLIFVFATMATGGIWGFGRWWLGMEG